jgi:predicted transglutaminase-like cysteine proteinase
MQKRHNKVYRSIVVALIASITSIALTSVSGAIDQPHKHNSLVASRGIEIVSNKAGVTSLGVFQSVAISAAKLPAARKWQDATRRDYRAFFTDDCADAGLSQCDTPFARKAQRTMRQTTGLSGLPLLRAVNRGINAALPYQSDAETWNQPDRWVTMSELSAKGVGDCEDYAIAKYWLLRASGFPSENLQIVVLADTRRQAFHAVLVAHYNNAAYVLDNLSNTLRTDASIKNYMPIMSFSDGKNYIHGFTNPTNNVAVNLSKVAPGEGF